MPMISITNPSARDLALYAVYLVVVIDIFASALSVPIMPFYVRDLCGCESMDAAASCADPVCNRLGGATASLGFMFSSFAIAQLISNAWLGPLSNAVGRKAILGITLSGAAIGAFASGLAPTYSWLVGARIFIGFCSGTMSTANAYIADISNAKERPALMANVAGPCQNPQLHRPLGGACSSCGHPPLQRPAAYAPALGCPHDQPGRRSLAAWMRSGAAPRPKL